MKSAHDQFTVSAEVYDLIYSEVVDYAAHARHVAAIIQGRRPGAGTVLEMACGTGKFLAELSDGYTVVGADISDDMLAICRRNHPNIELHEGDYATLDLGMRFDAVLCLFSGIGYVQDLAGLERAVSNLAKHAAPGGVVIIDGWLRPDAAIDGFQSQQSFEENGVLVTRSTLAFVRDGRTDMYAGHVVNDGVAIRTYVERHQMGLFGDEQYLAAMEAAGLSDLEVLVGFDGRGRFVGSR